MGFWLGAQPVSMADKNLKDLQISTFEEARLLAEVFVLSFPLTDPNELVDFVQNKPYYFQKNGLVTEAASRLGNWILERHQQGFDPDCLTRIQSQLKKNNIPEAYAEKLVSEIRNGKFDCRIVAKELIWLSEILPAISKGDLNAYLNTGTEIREQLVKLMLTNCKMQNSDPEIAELILHDKYCYHQKMADRVQILALISNTEK